MHIREALDSELNTVLSVEADAFGYEKEANLVRDLLGDPTARPYLSLLAFEGDKAVGHILFTRARLDGDGDSRPVMLLAPLAVVPDHQGKGIGGALIKHGLQMLSEAGVELVFVLGHPGYYPRYGFQPAGRLGLDAPYPIPEEHAGAWMVQELKPGVLGLAKGTVGIAEALDKPEHWRE